MSDAGNATSNELLRIREELLEPAYEAARAALTAAKLHGGDAIMLAHPIKAPFLEMWDSLGHMADEIEEGRWS